MQGKRKLTTLGKLIIKALTDQDMTRAELARRVGTSPQYLSYILYGVRSGRKYMPAIIRELNLPTELLEPNTGEKSASATLFSQAGHSEKFSEEQSLAAKRSFF